MPQEDYCYVGVGEQIAAEAWERFERWCRQYDPDGDMDTLDLADAYDLANGLCNNT